MRKGGGYGGQAKYSAETFIGMYEKYGGEQPIAKGGFISGCGLINKRARRGS